MVASLSDPTRDIALGARIAGVGEYLVCIVHFNQISEVKECRALADTRGLLHRVGDDNNRKPLA
jgi:hypothetical protein